MQNDGLCTEFNRREFIGAAVVGVSAPLLLAQRSANAAAGPRRDVEYGNPLREFDYGEVHFAPGLHEMQLQQVHATLMALNEDSLLHPFRSRAGVAAPGRPLPGWYGSEDFFPGHCFGQWISALARYFAITGDMATRAKVDRLLKGFAEVAERSGRFYENNRTPAYIYDKLVCGL